MVMQLMGRKVTEMLATGKYDKSEMLPTLRTYEANLLERVTQVDKQNPTYVDWTKARKGAILSPAGTKLSPLYD